MMEESALESLDHSGPTGKTQYAALCSMNIFYDQNQSGLRKKLINA